jgi:hypothetical protein
MTEFVNEGRQANNPLQNTTTEADARIGENSLTEC